MKKVPFVKYTSYGNNFVIVDESEGCVLTESEKSQFAYHATNTCFGIGCDNLLVLQPYSRKQLLEINDARGYWETVPDLRGVDFVFRMFEPNGIEAFSCGNGLMSIAEHLYRRYRTRSARIMTEVPLTAPTVVELGFEQTTGESWVDLGPLRRVPEHVASANVRKPIDECIDVIEQIAIRFRSNDLRAYTKGQTLQMKGYLVFTGEPHLVIFPHLSFSDPTLASPLFSHGHGDAGNGVGRRVSLGSWLVRRIGVFLNDNFRSHFPSGINVSFAHVDAEQRTVEYRCFERGINRETLACGTGAVAVGAVARRLGLVNTSDLRVLPHLCRWHVHNASIGLREGSAGHWRLAGTPKMLLEGSFAMVGASEQEMPLDGAGYDTLDLAVFEEELEGKPALAFGL